MSRLAFVLLLLLVAIVSIQPSLAAETVVSDPRMSQLVTVECVNVRLHTALEKVSEKSGVAIRCGNGTDDWAIRDIPVVVCVKDLPLAKLIRAIADSTHLTLTSSKVKGVYVYRIWRDTSTEKDLADYEAARKAAGIARATYDWDLWAEIDQIPDSEFQLSPRFEQAELAVYKAIGSAVRELGPEAKQDILAGNPIPVDFRAASEGVREKLCSAFKGLYEHFADVRRRRGDSADEPPTDLELDRSNLMICFGSGLEYPDSLEIMAFIQGHGYTSYGDRTLDGPSRFFPKQRLENRPPKPEMPAPIKNDGLKRRYKSIDHSDGPIAGKKVKLDKWKDKKSPTYADAVAAMAKASGLSIVATDFESYRMGFVESLKTELPGLFGREVSVGKVLFHFNCGKSGFDCFSDEAGTLVVGCDKEWTERVKTMVPEKLLSELVTKLGGSGVGLDDLEPVGRLTYDQCHQWLYARSEWNPVFRLASSVTRKGSLWPLYYMLSDSDRKKAKAGQKVRMANYDADQVMAVLSRAAKSMRTLRMGDGSPLPPGAMNNAEAFCDPDVVRTLTLRLTKRQIPKTGKQSYFLELDGERQGKSIANRDNLGAFPTYSPEREAELEKEKAGK